MDIDALRPLKYVFAAAEHGSMRRAARAFGVQQSSVSRSIIGLEQILEMQIFDRHTSGVRLTRQGRAWLANVRAHYDGLQEAVIQTARRKQHVEKLRIGLGSPLGREFLIHLIERFEKIHPDVETAVEDITCGKHVAAVCRRDLDIAFVHGRCETGSCRSEAVWEERLSALLPASHRLTEKQALTWADLADEHLLVPLGREGPQFDPGFLKQIAGEGGGPVIRQCHASQGTVIVQVQLGKGFTVAGESFAKAVSIDSTVWRPLCGKNSISPVTAIWLDSNPKRALLRLVGIARNLARKKRV